MTIKSVANGYILETENETTVFQSNEIKEYGELEAAQGLLYAIIIDLGLYGSKHDGKRLRITLEDNSDASGVE